jgi:hypothetical protein
MLAVVQPEEAMLNKLARPGGMSLHILGDQHTRNHETHITFIVFMIQKNIEGISSFHNTVMARYVRGFLKAKKFPHLIESKKDNESSTTARKAVSPNS